MHVSELETPALLIDLDIMERNLQKVAGYAREHNLRLRPHTKTHKIPALGRMQIELGAPGLTVAKVGEAQVMLNASPPDLLVAVVEDGKTFHVPTCAFIHDKARLRTIPAAEAIREGYAPCVRCMKQYLTEVSLPDLDDADQSLAASEDPTR